MNNSDSDKPFVLKSDKAFAERRKNVFDQLSGLESNLSSSRPSPGEDMEVDSPPSIKKSDRFKTKHLKGKESIFKRPQDPITKNFIRRMPDFKKNPHKWVKYSLDDVKAEDMSDRSNSKAAWSFINELRSRRSLESEQETMEEEDKPKRIVFTKRTVLPKNVDEESKPSFASSKVVMPEYVIGRHKVKKDKKIRDTKNSTGKEQMKLDHLYEEDD